MRLLLLLLLVLLPLVTGTRIECRSDADCPAFHRCRNRVCHSITGKMNPSPEWGDQPPYYFDDV